jgi:hypothetical protein
MKQIAPIRNQRNCGAATREITRLMDKEVTKKLTKAEYPHAAHARGFVYLSRSTPEPLPR